MFVTIEIYTFTSMYGYCRFNDIHFKMNLRHCVLLLSIIAIEIECEEKVIIQYLL